MTTATRTDIHRPSAEEFDPQAYELKGCFDLSPEPGDYFLQGQHRIEVTNALLAQGYHFSGVHGMGKCDHCGVNVRYAALLAHPQTRGLIWVGETCLDNRFSLTATEFRKLRENASLNRDRMRKAEKVALILAELTPEERSAYEWALSKTTAEGAGYADDGTCLTVAWEDATPEMRSARQDRGWAIAQDIALKVAQYTSPLSPRQLAFLVRLHGEYLEKVASRAAEAAAVASGELTPVPSGRMVVTGEIVSTKWQDSQFGGTLKMLVRSVDGWKVWGTVPSSLSDPQRGEWVEFTATLEPSRDDPQFGFFSRPAKAKNIIGPDTEEEMTEEAPEAAPQADPTPVPLVTPQGPSRGSSSPEGHSPAEERSPVLPGPVRNPDGSVARAEDFARVTAVERVRVVGGSDYWKVCFDYGQPPDACCPDSRWQWMLRQDPRGQAPRPPYRVGELVHLDDI